MRRLTQTATSLQCAYVLYFFILLTFSDVTQAVQIFAGLSGGMWSFWLAFKLSARKIESIPYRGGVLYLDDNKSFLHKLKTGKWEWEA